MHTRSCIKIVQYSEGIFLDYRRQDLALSKMRPEASHNRVCKRASVLQGGFSVSKAFVHAYEQVVS